MSVIFQRILYILFILASCFFLLFGIHLLFAAYRLNHPAWFVMTFFASNLIILISGTILVGLVLRLFASKKYQEQEKKENQ